jgi:hypothetical protein
METVGEEYDPVISRPLITGIGAGTTPPDGPLVSPLIVQDKVNGVDVVTCVTECHLHFSGIKVKIDSEGYVGEEGAPVFHKGTKVGMVTVEEYGSKMIHVGGINTLSRKNGWVAAKIIADIANRGRVELRVRAGAKIEVQVGQKPVINGKQMERRRFGCGTEVCDTLTGVYLKEFIEKGKINQLIVMDRGQQGGPGWGMTPVKDPLEIIESIDSEIVKPGFTILFTETSGDRCALYEFSKVSKFRKVQIPRELEKAMDEFRAQCEPARVSAYFMGGSGGTARWYVTKRPLRLSEAFRDKKATLTVGGSPAFVLVGGGINFMVDVERVKPGVFSWTGAPATIIPLEYTMKLEDYAEINGHLEAIRPLQNVLEDLKDVKKGDK